MEVRYTNKKQLNTNPSDHHFYFPFVVHLDDNTHPNYIGHKLLKMHPNYDTVSFAFTECHYGEIQIYSQARSN
jgi:hypothetical protein